MTKALRLLPAILVALVGLTVFSSQAYAATCPPISNVIGIGVELPPYEPGKTHRFTINMSQGFDLSRNYFFSIDRSQLTQGVLSPIARSPYFTIDSAGNSPRVCNNQDCVQVNDYIATFEIGSESAWTASDDDISARRYHVSLRYQSNSGDAEQCDLGTYDVSRNDDFHGPCSWTISQVRGDRCYYSRNSCISHNPYHANIDLQVEGLRRGNQPYSGLIELSMSDGDGGGEANETWITATNGSFTTQIQLDSSAQETTFGIQVMAVPEYKDFHGCSFEIKSYQSCAENQCNTEPISFQTGDENSSTTFYLCDQLPEGSKAKTDCIKCATGNPGATEEGEGDREGIWTAVGCIKRSPKDIIGTLMRLGLTMGGGVALLMILGSGFILSTSAGDPKRTGEAKEMMVAAITGLIFVIFSVAILQFIGFSVLQIPGFGGN